MRNALLILLLSCLSVFGQGGIGRSLLALPEMYALADAASATHEEIIITGIGQTNTTAGSTTYTLAVSNAPSADTLLLAGVVSATDAETPTFTGFGMEWELVANTNFVSILSPTYNISVFRAMTNNTPTGDAPVATFSGSQLGCVMRVVQLSGVDTSGSNGSGAVDQAAMNAQNNTENMTLTMAALESHGSNAVVSFSGMNFEGGIGPETGWTEDWDVSISAPSMNGASTYRIGTTDNTVFHGGGGGMVSWGIIGVEVNAAVSAGGGPSWSDPSDNEQLIGWYGSTDGATNDATPIQFWEDASPIGRHVRDTGTPFPTYFTGVYNGRDIVRFGNSTHNMFDAGGVYPQPLTMIAVVKITEDAQVGMIMADTNTAAISYWWYGSSKNWRLESSTRLEDPTDFDTNQLYVVTMQLDGANSLIRTNGTQAIAGDAGTLGLHGISLGGDTGPGVYMQGDIGELILCATNLSAAIVASNEFYLSTNWGITLP